MTDLRHRTHRPRGPLGRYVREILWLASNSPRQQILLPETAFTLVLRQSGSASFLDRTLPSATVSGLQPHSRTVQHSTASSLVVVRFTEIGGPALLHHRADLFYNRILPLDTLLPQSAIDQVQNALADARDLPRQIAAMEDFLTRQLSLEAASPRSSSAPPQVEAATRLIRATHGQASVTSLAHRVGMSLSALERQFRATVGASPKHLSRLARLHHVCALWDTGHSLTEIAFEAGYSDQPHMVHDLRRITGASPLQLFSSSTPRNLPTFYK